jgi:hypothetical protein
MIMIDHVHCHGWAECGPPPPAGPGPAPSESESEAARAGPDSDRGRGSPWHPDGPTVGLRVTGRPRHGPAVRAGSPVTVTQGTARQCQADTARLSDSEVTVVPRRGISSLPGPARGTAGPRPCGRAFKFNLASSGSAAACRSAAAMIFKLPGRVLRLG